MNKYVFMYHVLRCLLIIARKHSSSISDMHYLFNLDKKLDKMEEDYV